MGRFSKKGSGAAPGTRTGMQGGAHTGEVRPESDEEKITRQIEMGEVQAGAEGARKIAERIENQGGFWGRRKEGK